MTAPVRVLSRKILFAGTPEFALAVLRALHGAGYAVPAVITRPDRAAGRGRKLAASPVKAWAQEGGLELLQPESWKDAPLTRQLEDFGADLLVVAAYGSILPAAALAACARGAVNVHASLLPRWRGASPVAAAILAGDSHTGVTLMQMDAGLDTGPVLAARRTRIEPHETAGALEGRLARLGADLLLEQLPAILAGKLEAVPQDSALSSYAPLISKRQGPSGLDPAGRCACPLRARFRSVAGRARDVGRPAAAAVAGAGAGRRGGQSGPRSAHFPRRDGRGHRLRRVARTGGSAAGPPPNARMGRSARCAAGRSDPDVSGTGAGTRRVSALAVYGVLQGRSYGALARRSRIFGAGGRAAGIGLGAGAGGAALAPPPRAVAGTTDGSAAPVRQARRAPVRGAVPACPHPDTGPCRREFPAFPRARRCFGRPGRAWSTRSCAAICGKVFHWRRRPTGVSRDGTRIPSG